MSRLHAINRRLLSPRRLDPRSRSRRIHRIRFEILEDRRLLSLPPVTWVATSSGNWDVGSNWSTGQVPGSTDDVVINPSAALTVTINSSVPPVNSLQSGSNATLAVSGGSLTLAAASEIDGAFTLSGGTLTASGTLTTNGDSSWTGGTINANGNLVNDSNVDVPAGAGPTIGGVLTNDGTISITSAPNTFARLYVSGLTLGGTGQLILDEQQGGTAISRLLRVRSDAHRRVGPDGRGLRKGRCVQTPAPSSTRGSSRRTEGLEFDTPITNQGQMRRINGGTLLIDKSVDNSQGQISVNAQHRSTTRGPSPADRGHDRRHTEQRRKRIPRCHHRKHPDPERRDHGRQRNHERRDHPHRI